MDDDQVLQEHHLRTGLNGGGFSPYTYAGRRLTWDNARRLLKKGIIKPLGEEQTRIGDY